MKLTPIVLAAFFSVGLSAQKPLNIQSYPECAADQRNATLSEGDCLVRMVARIVPKCGELSDDGEYRKCAAKAPKYVVSAPIRADYVPDPAIAESSRAMAEAQKQLDDANRALDQLAEGWRRTKACLRKLRVGSSESRVKACGDPDYVNGDMQGSDQWVFASPHGDDQVYVYLSHTHRVVNMQLSE